MCFDVLVAVPGKIDIWEPAQIEHDDLLKPQPAHRAMMSNTEIHQQKERLHRSIRGKEWLLPHVQVERLERSERMERKVYMEGKGKTYSRERTETGTRTHHNAKSFRKNDNASFADPTGWTEDSISHTVKDSAIDHCITDGVDERHIVRKEFN